MNYSLLRAAGSLKHKRISLPAPVSFCIFLSSFLLSVSIHMSQSALKCVLKKKKKNQLLISPSLLYKITYFLIDLISCFHILKRESLGSIFKSLILMNSVPGTRMRKEEEYQLMGFIRETNFHLLIGLFFGLSHQESTFPLQTQLWIIISLGILTV